MRVGLAALRAEHARGVMRALEDACITIAWVATDAVALAERSSADPPDVIVVSGAGPFDALCALASPAPGEGSTGLKRWAILAVVDDPVAEVHEAYATLERGASDVARAPVLRADGTLDDPDRIVTRLRNVSGVRSGSETAQAAGPFVLVAASTGGPPALARVLATLPAAPAAAVLLVQHIEETDSLGLASWLSTEAGRTVVLAEEGALLCRAHALLVRADRQPTLDAEGRVRYRRFSDTDVYRPSIDRLFLSAVTLRPAGSAALLTGMGDDGARGMLALRGAGWRTIAQDRATSAVYGMPAAAVGLGAATQTLPLDEIGPALVRAAARVPA